MCTFWQRVGRTARDTSIHGFAILLAEPKHFDEEKDKKEAASQKRKATNQVAGKSRKHRAIAKGPKSKQPTALPIATEVEEETQEAQEELEDNETDFVEARRIAYRAGRIGKLSPLEPVKATKKFEMELAMEDLINADTRGLGCRRKVFQLYFGTGELCTCLLPRTTS